MTVKTDAFAIELIDGITQDGSHAVCLTTVSPSRTTLVPTAPSPTNGYAPVNLSSANMAAAAYNAGALAVRSANTAVIAFQASGGGWTGIAGVIVRRNTPEQARYYSPLTPFNVNDADIVRFDIGNLAILES